MNTTLKHLTMKNILKLALLFFLISCEKQDFRSSFIIPESVEGLHNFLDPSQTEYVGKEFAFNAQRIKPKTKLRIKVTFITGGGFVTILNDPGWNIEQVAERFVIYSTTNSTSEFAAKANILEPIRDTKYLIEYFIGNESKPAFSKRVIVHPQ